MGVLYNYEADLRLIGELVAAGGDVPLGDEFPPSSTGLHASRSGNVVVLPRGRAPRDPDGQIYSLVRLDLATNRIDRIVVPAAMPVSGGRLELSPSGQRAAVMLSLEDSSDGIFVVDLRQPARLVELLRRPSTVPSDMVWANERKLYFAETPIGQDACLSQLDTESPSDGEQVFCVPGLSRPRVRIERVAGVGIVHSVRGARYVTFDPDNARVLQAWELRDRKYLTALPDGRLVFGARPNTPEEHSGLLVVGPDRTLHVTLGGARVHGARVLIGPNPELVMIRSLPGENDWYREVVIMPLEVIE